MANWKKPPWMQRAVQTSYHSWEKGRQKATTAGHPLWVCGGRYPAPILKDHGAIVPSGEWEHVWTKSVTPDNTS